MKTLICDITLILGAMPYWSRRDNCAGDVIALGKCSYQAKGRKRHDVVFSGLETWMSSVRDPAESALCVHFP